MALGAGLTLITGGSDFGEQVTGTLDPSAHPTLPTVFYAGKAIGAIERAPQNGDLVMAVVKLERPVDTNTGVSTFIFSDICTFMPGKSAMVVLKSLEDAVVTETLKRLQEARAHPQR